MEYPLDKEHWKKSKVKFGDNDKLLSIAAYHRNPNLAQVFLWRATSPMMTQKYFTILTNRQVILVPIVSMGFKVEPILYKSFEDVNIIKDDGALEVKNDEKKPLRVYPDTLANKIHSVDLEKFLEILRSCKSKGKVITSPDQTVVESSDDGDTEMVDEDE